ncbi:hypothetical protein EIN_283810 [Entamoeba invadens IP1]|uniref:Uncharacterized protein n=1 Tax=Entamoeba invadens IP1 TaxID=370355 RepID=L7FJW7_ENTIV|nr:hypothetical protein EIN_283810 [Entamoeba invadens IP1]ELP84835.1 hypothetical protein EIN_283810 [Entamoeba invadens IP1]|eukprot:XP_004184181.1 hypothetical protein EIN_283810 [Entamoeba invadens IP1]
MDVEKAIQTLQKQMKELQIRVDVLESENNILKRQNMYLGLMMTTKFDENSTTYCKRLWGDEIEFDSPDKNEEGTFPQILQCVLENSQTDAVDMFVVTQLADSLMESRLNSLVSIDSIETINSIVKKAKDEDYSIGLKCLRSVATSNTPLIPFCVDEFCEALNGDCLVDKITALDGLYTASRNNHSEVVLEKISKALLKFSTHDGLEELTVFYQGIFDDIVNEIYTHSQTSKLILSKMKVVQ